MPPLLTPLEGEGDSEGEGESVGEGWGEEDEEEEEEWGRPLFCVAPRGEIASQPGGLRHVLVF